MAASDYAQTAANVLASAYAKRLQPLQPFTFDGMRAIPNLLIAGATLTAGMPVYEGTDGKFYPADANGADPAYKCQGIAEHGSAAGQPISVVYEDPEFTPGCTMLVGATLVVSDTAGKICDASDVAAGFYNTILGGAWSTTQMNLKIIRTDAVKV